MSNNKQLFDMASLAEATYADFIENGILKTNTSDVVQILKDKGWSDTQGVSTLTPLQC